MLIKNRKKVLSWILGILAVVCTSASMVVIQPAAALLVSSEVIPTPIAVSNVLWVSNLDTVPSVYITMSGMPAVVTGKRSSFDLAVSEGHLARFSQ